MFKSFDYRKLVIISASILMLIGLRVLSKGSSVTEWKQQTAGFSYEMPRVSSVGNEFDLSGREIDRQIMSEEQKKEAAKVAEVGVAKKDDKKARAKDAKKQAKNKDDKNKKKQFATNVVDTRQDSANQSLESGRATDVQVSAPYYDRSQNLNASTPAQNKQQDDHNPDEEKKLTAAQWQALLSQTPSAENVAKFVKAHAEGKIVDQDFYGIVFAFYQEPNATHREVAMNILTADKSPAQFLYLAKNYSKVDEQKRAALWTLMLGFTQGSRIGALNGAIMNQDIGVVQLGLQVLKYAVELQARNNGAGARGIAAAGPQTFVIFIGSLNTVSRQQNTNAQLAASILAEIQSMLNK